MAWIGSIVFVVWMYGLMAVLGILFAPTLLGPRSWTRWAFRVYLALVFGGLQVLCGIRYEVRGREHMPTGGALVASKHQSMFETLAFWAILPDPAIILKKGARLPAGLRLVRHEAQKHQGGSLGGRQGAARHAQAGP